MSVSDNLTDKIASKYLGKKSHIDEIYNPELLVAVPRSENRLKYEINSDNLPFSGFDVWHAYEFSFLTKNNVPITRVLKIKYSCESEFIVESKSLKLYLNSFNMTQFGKNMDDGLQICKKIIQKDLSDKLKTQVEVNFIKDEKYTKIFSEFTSIYNLINENNVCIKEFKENPKILKTEEIRAEKKYFLKFDGLRSNCRVTHQPDFGDAFIYYKSSKHITEDSLIEYLTSFRSEYHFHEECCEMIFKRLSDILNNSDELIVCALYTRRGGIDINPVRWKNCQISDVEKLADMDLLTRNGIKQ